MCIRDRSIPGFITEVILELTTCQFRTRSRFGSNETSLFSFLYGVAHERERDTSEVGTTSETTDHDIRILACHFHLFFSFQSDNSLVESHVAKYGTERIFTVRSCLLYTS